MDIKTGRVTSNGLTKSWYIGTPEPVKGLKWGNTTTQTIFTKPDKIIRNPKVNGYRQPSSWSGKHREVAVSADVKVRGSAGSSMFEHKGTVACWIPKLTAHLAVPKGVDALRMKILLNIRSEVLDAAMVLAEMQGTVSTLASNLDRLGRTLLAIKQRKPLHYDVLMHGRRPRNLAGKKLDKFNREVAGTYLEWKYGVMPVIYDIQGAAKALDMNEKGSLFDNPPLLVARATDVVVDNPEVFVVGNTSYFDLKGNLQSVRRTELKARCDYRVSGEGLRGLNRYGLGLGTVATLAWERTPFSFVVNMAFPLADLIKAWTALSGCEVVSYCETAATKLSIQGGRLSGRYGIDITGTVDTVPSLLGFVRTAYPTVPMPMPFVRNPIKTGNIATVLALFTQLRNRA